MVIAIVDTSRHLCTGPDFIYYKMESWRVRSTEYKIHYQPASMFTVSISIPSSYNCGKGSSGSYFSFHGTLQTSRAEGSRVISSSVADLERAFISSLSFYVLYVCSLLSVWKMSQKLVRHDIFVLTKVRLWTMIKGSNQRRLPGIIVKIPACHRRDLSLQSVVRAVVRESLTVNSSPFLDFFTQDCGRRCKQSIYPTLYSLQVS